MSNVLKSEGIINYKSIVFIFISLSSLDQRFNLWKTIDLIRHAWIVVRCTLIPAVKYKSIRYILLYVIEL